MYSRINRQVLLLIGLLVLVCIGLFFILSLDAKSTNQIVINMEVSENKLIRPALPIVIEKGKSVRFKIQTDVEEEFHLEGYHAFTQLKPDKTMILDFDALSGGKFPMYLDRSKTFLGIVEVVE